MPDQAEYSQIPSSELSSVWSISKVASFLQYHQKIESHFYLSQERFFCAMICEYRFTRHCEERSNTLVNYCDWLLLLWIASSSQWQYIRTDSSLFFGLPRFAINIKHTVIRFFINMKIACDFYKKQKFLHTFLLIFLIFCKFIRIKNSTAQFSC